MIIESYHKFLYGIFHQCYNNINPENKQIKLVYLPFLTDKMKNTSKH